MSFEVQALLYGVVVPFGVATLTLLTAKLFRRERGEQIEGIAGALALGLAFAIGYLLLEIEPLKPKLARQWIPLLTLSALAVGVLEVVFRLPTWARLLTRTAVSAVVAWLVIPSWESLAEDRLVWQIGLGGSVLLVWTAVAQLANQQPSRRLTFLLGLVVAGAGIVMQQSGNSKFTQSMGLVGGALLGFLVVSWKWPDWKFLQGAASGFAVLLCGTVLTGKLEHFSQVPALSFYLVIATPVVLSLSLLISSDRWSQRRQFLTQLAMMLPLYVAVGMAFTATME